MLIKKAEIFYIKLAMKSVFKTSFGEIKYRPAVIIKMTDKENNIGWGEASLLDLPISEEETTDKGINVLEKNIVAKLIGCKINSLDQFYDIFKKYFDNHPITMAGVEMAFLNLWILDKKINFVKLFGGKKKKIIIGNSIGMQREKNVLLKMVATAVEKKFDRIKVKIMPGHDVDIVKFIRKNFPKIDLSVDANGAYKKNDFNIFKELDKYNLEMIEQPFAKNEFALHAKLQKEIKTPICLDESVIDIKTAKRAIKTKAGKIINIKPARVGGYRRAIEIHDLCQKNGIPNWIGSRLETGITRVFNLALATLPNFILPSEIIPSEVYLKKDILSNIAVFRNGSRRNNNMIIVNNKFLNTHCIYHKVFEI